MDEDADSPERQDTGPDVADGAPAGGPLIERLDELRMQLEILAPRDRHRGREAIELLYLAQERIGTLERMLAWARDREEHLTARLVRDHMQVAELEAKVEELRAMAETASEAEDARLRASADAAEWKQRLTVVHAELEEKQTEVRRLSSRCADLEADLMTLGDELASSTVARTKAERLERERDVARERARAEAQQALEDRLRAMDAERQLAALRHRLRETEQRPTGSIEEEVPDGEPDEPSEARRGGAAAAPPILEPGDGAEIETEEGLEPPEDESIRAEEEDVVDLTQETQEWDDADRSTGYEGDEMFVWASEKPGLLAWLRRGLLGEDEAEEDEPDLR